VLYDWQPEESTALWEKASILDPNFPITWRNLAISYSHEQTDNAQTKAITSLEKAVATTNPYPTHFAELDRLYQAAGAPVEKRLALLEKNQNIVIRNDEALGGMITLKIFAGKTNEAIKLLQGRTFSIWEGATPFNTGQAWMDAHLVRGLQLLKAKKYKEALADFTAAANPPENLRAQGGRGGASSDVEITYWTGCAYAGLGDKAKAQKFWNEVITPNTQTSGAGGAGGTGAGPRRMGGNSLNQGEQRYYQALAKQKLGIKEGNEAVFNELVTSAAAALNQPANTSADASQFSRRQPNRSNAAIAHYNAGLGYTGLGNKTKAREEFNAALTSSPDYLNAKIALDQL
jgi:tetratricopeptide (TPR) repeat protein